MFEGLNDQAIPLNIPEFTLHNIGSTYYTELNIPQNYILFIHPAAKRDNYDFYAFLF